MTTQEEAYHHLVIVKKVLLREGPAKTADYFSALMDRWRFGNMSLDEAAYVKPGKHEKRITRQMLMANRDESIRDAANLLFVTSYFQATNDLSQYIKEFYPMWVGGYKNLAEPDTSWSDLKTAIFWAHFFGSRSRIPPRTYKGLWPIVKSLTEV